MNDATNTRNTPMRSGRSIGLALAFQEIHPQTVCEGAESPHGKAREWRNKPHEEEKRSPERAPGAATAPHLRASYTSEKLGKQTS